MLRAAANPLVLSLCLAATACGGDGSGALPPPALRSARLIAEPTIGKLGTPFDALAQDLVGPGDSAAMVGKRPEIVALAAGTEVDVLFQDTTDPHRARHFVVRLSPSEDTYVVSRALEVPALDRIAGFARDEAGRYVVATAVDEALHGEGVTASHPPAGQHRANVLRIFVVDPETAEIVLDVDVDRAREEADPTSEPIVDPMAWSTSRLSVHGPRIGLLLGHLTAADARGARSQKSVATSFDLGTGDVVSSGSAWISRSCDQRLLHDGTGFVELHLGDAYPRSIAIARAEAGDSMRPIFFPKGAIGESNTRTRLGDVVVLPPTGGSPDYGYLAVFATERTTTTTPVAPAPGHPLVAGSRELAVVRVLRDFGASPVDGPPPVDPTLPDTLTVESGGVIRENHLRFLTDYQRDFPGLRHAERPKLVAVSDDRFVLLFERWSFDLVAGRFRFDGTFGLVLDQRAEILHGPTRLTAAHLPRGDDAFALDGRAAFVTGDATNRRLILHLVDASLRYVQFVVD